MADEKGGASQQSSERGFCRSNESQASALDARSSTVSAKDIITISLSAGAFIISALTAYFTLLRTVDDVRVALGQQAPVAIYHSKEGSAGKLHISDLNYELIFINAGNRPVAITEVSFNISQLWNAKSSPQCGGGWPISYRPTRLVLKPGEILSHNLSLHERQVLEAKDEFLHFPLVERERGPIVALGCFEFVIGTPSEMKRVIKPVWKAAYEPHPSDSAVPKLLEAQTVVGRDEVTQVYRQQCITLFC